MKFIYYLNYMMRAFAPQIALRYRKSALEKKFNDKKKYIDNRVRYYVKLRQSFELPKDAVSRATFKHKGQSQYVIDLMSIMSFFPKHYRFLYYFGDETHIEPYPTLFKARPINGDNHNSVLTKLVKSRHFRFYPDKRSFQEKKNLAVFRGAVKQPHRVRFMETMFNHPLIDAGQSNPSNLNPEWQKPFMSVEEQMDYKFIICLEGHDVASNLKWAMSSNSVVITPKMKYETWFMEGTLQAGVHYVEVKDDWSDFEEKIQFYINHPEEAENIVHNAHRYLLPFKDNDLEELVSIKTLEKYFELSGQVKQ
ncbi:lipopolysaccharide A protein [Vibrio sp. SCSIO 43135]|uniref:Lipopolysaccharide A protein n=1 Tax=Vibrio paucivorans TaxID=2829489 RepID=A0A9X3CD47_9VIBR|nr:MULTISPECIES: glycosyl transferase family 90 [Vibrio]MCW8333604.1 lipopolysaccharide A protein [Vibrio paucivorans]USD42498.1 lipopolysaccharide A protein [Vibrio sp. SCSIO 43135]